MVFLTSQLDTDVSFQLTTPAGLSSGEKDYADDILEIPAISPMNLTSPAEEETLLRKKIIDTLTDFAVKWNSSLKLTSFSFAMPKWSFPKLQELSLQKTMEDEISNMETEEISEIEAALNSKYAAEQKIHGSDNQVVFIKRMKKNHEQSSFQASYSNSKFQYMSNHSLLLIATCIAATSLLGVFQTPGQSIGLKSIFRGFIFLNSGVFFASLALVTFLMRGLPILPWLIISVSSTIGIYMCAIVAKFPGEIVPVLWIGCSIFLTAFKAFDFFHWFRTTIHVM